MNPVNLIVRFLLEIISLIVVGIWGWKATNGWLQFIVAFGAPFFMASLWGIFNVPNDPSRSGRAIIVVKGWVRLLIEALVFGVGIVSIYALDHIFLSSIYGLIIALHYIISKDRINWLISRNQNTQIEKVK